MRVPLQSSLLAWADYDAARHRLQLAFHSGERYLYFLVPPECFQHLLQANSKGAYFNIHIRNCFPFQHLSRLAVPPYSLCSDQN